MKKEVAKARAQYVVKANEMIQKTRYSLTLQQQKFILFAISKIKPCDDVRMWYTTNVREICEVCGINIDGGDAFASIKDDVKALTKREFALFPDGHERTVAWLGDVDVTPADGTIRFQFHQFTAPLLFELKQRYTQYQLQNVLVFHSVHTIRLYEYLKSYTSEAKLSREGMIFKRTTADEIRTALGAEAKYPQWTDFERFVLKKAVDEINEYADDFYITYMTVKEGRSVARVDFQINKRSVYGVIAIRTAKQKRLEHKEGQKR